MAKEKVFLSNREQARLLRESKSDKSTLEKEQAGKSEETEAKNEATKSSNKAAKSVSKTGAN